MPKTVFLLLLIPAMLLQGCNPYGAYYPDQQLVRYPIPPSYPYAGRPEALPRYASLPPPPMPPPAPAPLGADDSKEWTWYDTAKAVLLVCALASCFEGSKSTNAGSTVRSGGSSPPEPSSSGLPLPPAISPFYGSAYNRDIHGNPIE